MATCSSDRTIKIYDIELDPKNANNQNGNLKNTNSGRIDDSVNKDSESILQSTSATTNDSQQVTQHRLRETLRGHEGPVWQIAWAHPKFGTVLASCSYDGKVIVWTELQNGQWQKVKQFDHQASVNSIAWGPHEYDLSLAAGLSDGKINIFTCLEDGTWDTKTISAHSVGCNSVSWAPAIIPGSLIDLNSIQNYQESQGSDGIQGRNGLPVIKRIVSGGCDNCIKIWKFVAGSSTEPDNTNSANNATTGGSIASVVQGQWKEEHTIIDAHQDWIRDVAWAPSIGLPKLYIASCSQDKTVNIWVNDKLDDSTTNDNTNNANSNNNSWKKVILKPEGFGDAVWRVSWSTIGNILAVSSGDNKISLWKEDLEGQWIQI